MCPDKSRYKVAVSLAEVDAFGFSDAGVPENYETFGGSHWQSVLGEEISPIHAEDYGKQNQQSFLEKIYSELDGRWETMAEQLSERIPIDHENLSSEALCDAATTNLSYIAAYRAYFGEDSPFIAGMWNAFQTGGWPFGWFGEYPDGKMVVWKPKR